MNDDDILPHLEGYISLKKAAEMLRVAERTVYGYVTDGKLPGIRAGSSIVVKAEDVQSFRRGSPGRRRTRVPVWRLSIGEHLQYLTIIFVRIRPGQDDKLEQKLEELRSGEKHLLPGTVARYIARNEEKSEDVQIVLVWRSTVMPPQEEREKALAALRTELAEILDWETAWSENGRVLMHT